MVIFQWISHGPLVTINFRIEYFVASYDFGAWSLEFGRLGKHYLEFMVKHGGLD